MAKSSFEHESLEQKSIINSALDTISFEKQGLESLTKALQTTMVEPFFSAVEKIKNAKGRVIVTGLGKSGHIGAKIAATLASTGTPAFFVHAAEANHGDLGMIRQEDVILALSWSGKTVELSGILEHCARFSIPLIALTANSDSALGKQADVLLLLPKAKEACPHGLAPTTSTTIQLALGDALAVTLLKTRGFTAKDFKTFHPGGSLGARLKSVQDIMHVGDSLPMVQQGVSLIEAMKVLSQKHFGCVIITDENKSLKGILTEGDLVRNLERDLSKACVEDVMTKDPKTITAQTPIGRATALIHHHQISALVIVETQGLSEQKPIGIVHFHDLLRAGAL